MPEERLRLRAAQRDHVPAVVRRSRLPILDDAQHAVPRLLLGRHEIRHLRRRPRVLERALEHRQALVRDELRQGEARPLAAAEGPDLRVGRVALEPESPEEAAGPRLRRRWVANGPHLLEERVVEIQLLRLLREVADAQRPAPVHRARVRLLAADHDLQERRLPASVRPDEADAVALPELDVRVREQEASAVGLRDARDPDDALPTLPRLEGEAERLRRARAHLGRLPLHLLQAELSREDLLVHLPGLEFLDDRQLSLHLIEMPLALRLQRALNRIAF